MKKALILHGFEGRIELHVYNSEAWFAGETAITLTVTPTSCNWEGGYRNWMYYNNANTSDIAHVLCAIRDPGPSTAALMHAIATLFADELLDSYTDLGAMGDNMDCSPSEWDEIAFAVSLID